MRKLIPTMAMLIVCWTAQAQLPQGIVSEWPLTTSNSGIWNDIIGTNNLTQYGDVLLGNSSTGPCALFNSYISASSLECPGDSSLWPVNGCFTVSAWVFVLGTSSIGDHMCIVSKGWAEEDQWELFVSADLNHVWLDVGPGRIIYSKAHPPINQWFLVTAWCDGGKLEGVQINNRKPETSPTGMPLIVGTPHNFVVGAWNHSSGNDSFLNGGVKHLRYWNRVLTANERNTLWNIGPG